MKMKINLSVSSAKRLKQEIEEIRELYKFNNDKIIVNVDITPKENITDVSKSLLEYQKNKKLKGRKEHE